jgi:hypothetical protein
MSPSVEPRVTGTTRVHGLPVGAPQSAGGNAPIRLDGSEEAWLVVRGTLHVFAVPVHADAGDGAREFLYHLEAGALCFGVGGYAARRDASGDTSGDAIDETDALSMLAVGDVDTVVAPVTRADLIAALADEPASVAPRIAAYVARVREALWSDASDHAACDAGVFDALALDGNGTRRRGALARARGHAHGDVAAGGSARA